MGCVSVSLVSSERVIPLSTSVPIKFSLGSWPFFLFLTIQSKFRSLQSNFSSETMNFSGKTLSSLASDPLFSTIVTFCTLILLYFPTLFLGIIFSPVLISTSALLLSLLRLGAIQRSTQEERQNKRQKEKDSKTAEEFNFTQQSLNHPTHDLIIDDHKWVSSDSGESSECETENEIQKDEDSKTAEFNSTEQILNHPTRDLIIDDHKWVSERETDSAAIPRQKPFYADSFVEWDVRAPLEVIYEEYEGEEEEDEENEGVPEGKRDVQMAIIERYASLSKFYPDTDSDTSSEEDFLGIRDWDSPEHMCFLWEGEAKEGLIEIELGEKGYSEVEEENLIEIDLHPASFPAR